MHEKVCRVVDGRRGEPVVRFSSAIDNLTTFFMAPFTPLFDRGVAAGIMWEQGGRRTYYCSVIYLVVAGSRA